MKKTLTEAARLLCLLLLITPPLTSCSNDDDETVPMIVPQAEKMSFTSGNYAKRLPLEISGVAEWNADVAYTGSETGWVSVKKEAAAVLLTVEPNTGAARSAALRISAPGVADILIPLSQKAQFSSELIGSYVPDDAINEYYGAHFVTEWNEKGAPNLTLAGTELPWMLIEAMVPTLLGAYYSQGLAGLELMDDGRIGVKYHTVTLPDGIQSILDPVFGKEELAFPDAVTMPTVPLDVVTYYTKDGKIYLAADKRFIAQVDPGTLGAPICTMIDGMIAKYSLPVVNDADIYALPFKYTLDGESLLIYVDRSMILPFKQLLTDLIGQLLPAVDADGDGKPDAGAIDPAAIVQFVNDVFDNSTRFELGIYLKKQAA